MSQNNQGFLVHLLRSTFIRLRDLAVCKIWLEKCISDKANIVYGEDKNASVSSRDQTVKHKETSAFKVLCNTLNHHLKLFVADCSHI